MIWCSIDFPSEGVHRFDCILGLKIEILESCWLQMLCFKRKMKENRLFAFLFCLVRMKIFQRERKAFLLFVLVLEKVSFFLCSRFFFSLPKEFFFQKKSPAESKKFCLYRDYPKNPNLPPAVSQTLYRIKGFCCFDFSEDN